MINLCTASEDDVQRAFKQYCERQRDERKASFHIPNEGKRTKLGHINAVAKGLVPGASDNFIPAVRGNWHGLFLELKAKGKRPTSDQWDFGMTMQACGFAFAWADGIDMAIRVVEQYMAGKYLGARRP